MQAALSRPPHRAFVHTAPRPSRPIPLKGRYNPPPPPVLDDFQLNRLKKDSAKIIARVAKPPPYNHNYTPTLRGLEKRLSASLSANKHTSNEKAAFDADLQLEGVQEEHEVTGSFRVFSPGTFIETRRNDIYAHGIVLGEGVHNKRRRLTMLTASGEMWFPILDDVVFSIPNFVSSDLVARCGQDEIVSDPPHINARVRVLKELRELDREMERKLNVATQKCHGLYDRVRSPHPDQWSQITSTEVAHLIDRKNPTIYTYFAVHKFMMSRPLYYEAHDSYESTRIFRVRPKSHIDLIQTIQDWSRRSGGPIQTFGKKARQVIDMNRKLHQSSRNDPPSYHSASHSWTEDELKILAFLRHSSRRTRSTQNDPYSLGQSFILRQIESKRPRVSDHDVHMTLMDLGILAPWSDPTTMDPLLDLDLESEATSSSVRQKEAFVAQGFAAIPSHTPVTSLGPDEFHPKDPLESVRHDFGDLPVYVVDDASAEELDDGVSIERIPSEPNSFWVHVHIADPASLIHPQHTLAQEASRRSQSLYFIHRSWPLFPRSIMAHPTYGLSLGSRTDSPTNVLTFSCKIDSLGELKEVDVRAGLIRNLRVITYDEVDKALGRPMIPYHYPFGDPGRPKPLFPNLTASEIEDLDGLQKIADSVVAKRQREGVIAFGRPVAEFRTIVPPPHEINTAVFEPTHFKGFPHYEYSFVEQHLVDSGARNMVAEMMKMASRAASRFCTTHGIPVLRRVAETQQVGEDHSEVEALRNQRTPNNYISSQSGVPKAGFLANSGYSLEAGPHFGLGILAGEGYTRATSPLRRYLDLITHWQIHHILLGAAAPSQNPPFNETELGKIAIAVQATEKLHKSLQRNHIRYWQLMLLGRWLDGMTPSERKNNALLERLEAITMVDPTMNINSGIQTPEVEVMIPLLGLGGNLEGLDTPDIKPGTRFPVKIEEIRLGTRPRLSVVIRK